MQHYGGDCSLSASIDILDRNHVCNNEVVVVSCKGRGDGSALLWTTDNGMLTTSLNFINEPSRIPFAENGNNHTAVLISRLPLDGNFEYVSQLIVSIHTTSVNVCCTIESRSAPDSVKCRYLPISGKLKQVVSG